MKSLPWILFLLALALLLICFFKSRGKVCFTKSELEEMGYTFEGMSSVDVKDNIYEDLQNIIQLKKYEDSLKQVTTSEISLALANKYHKTFLNRRYLIKTGGGTSSTDSIVWDTTKAILFNLDTILTGLVKAFPSDFSFIDTSTWKDKGFLVYFANYGAGASTNPKILPNQSTALIQFARMEKNGDAKNVEGSVYNFGGLKPPKLVGSEQITGR